MLGFLCLSRSLPERSQFQRPACQKKEKLAQESRYNSVEKGLKQYYML
jgi:hypothetical protein